MEEFSLVRTRSKRKYKKLDSVTSKATKNYNTSQESSDDSTDSESYETVIDELSFYYADDSEWEVSDFQSTDDSDDEWIDN